MGHEILCLVVNQVSFLSFIHKFQQRCFNIVLLIKNQFIEIQNLLIFFYCLISIQFNIALLRSIL